MHENSDLAIEIQINVVLVIVQAGYDVDQNLKGSSCATMGLRIWIRDKDLREKKQLKLEKFRIVSAYGA